MYIWLHSCASRVVLFHKGSWYVIWYRVMNVILYKMSLFIFSSFLPFLSCVWGGRGKEELIFVLNSLVVTWNSTQGWSSTTVSSASACWEHGWMLPCPAPPFSFLVLRNSVFYLAKNQCPVLALCLYLLDTFCRPFTFNHSRKFCFR